MANPIEEIQHFFHKEFCLLCTPQCPNERLRFQLNYQQHFMENLISINTHFRLNLNEHDLSKLRAEFEIPYLLEMFEQYNYNNKTILDTIYSKEFDVSLLPHTPLLMACRSKYHQQAVKLMERMLKVVTESLPQPQSPQNLKTIQNP